MLEGGMTVMAGRRKLSEDDKAWMRELDAEGVTRSDIARRMVAERGVSVTKQWVAQLLGPKELRTPGSRVTNISLSDDDLATVRRIARDLGYRVGTGPRAGEGNLSAFLEGIARGEVEVRRREDRADGV